MRLMNSPPFRTHRRRQPDRRVLGVVLHPPQTNLHRQRVVKVFRRQATPVARTDHSGADLIQGDPWHCQVRGARHVLTALRVNVSPHRGGVKLRRGAVREREGHRSFVRTRHEIGIPCSCSETLSLLGQSRASNKYLVSISSLRMNLW